MYNKKISRRDFLELCAAAGTAAASGAMGILSCSRDDSPVPPPAGHTGETGKFISVADPNAPKPNILLINADDLGYGDLGCYGGRSIATTHIDRLAREGIRFTDFHACNALCSPSRIGLLTGRYPHRSGVTWPLWAKDDSLRSRIVKNAGHIMGILGLTDMGGDSRADGIHPTEITMAEALKVAGYRTGMVGKWHLGDFSKQPEYNPRKHGFDDFLGLPHSNDMWPCALYENEKEIEADIGLNQARLTGMYTKKAVEFIEGSKGKPFFFYFAHTFPHQPLFASERFKGKSNGGLYGDTVEEVDWSVGELMQCLRRNGLERNTIVIFTSDNGPWFEGSPGALRGRKGQSYEGGFRVPLIARWPGVIQPGGVCTVACMNIDLFPTFLPLAGLSLPKDRIIDGRSIYGLLTGRENKSPHEALFFYHHDELEGIRAGKWKYFRDIHHYVYPIPLDKEKFIFGRTAKGRLGRWPLLYDMELDPSESYNIIDTHPEIGKKLHALMEQWEQEMKKNPGGWISR